MEQERYEELVVKFGNMDMKELAVEFKELQEAHSMAKKAAAVIYAEFELIRKQIIPKRMDELGYETLKIKDVGRLQIGYQVSAKQLDKMALIEWLEAHNHPDIAAMTVNASTLGSFMKNQIADGEPIPDDSIVEFTTYEVASVVKA